MPTLSLSKLGSNGKAHNWTHVLTPLNELETFFNTTKLNYQNIQTNGIRSANVRAHAGVSTGRIKVRNSTGSTLTAGTLVYFSGTYNDGTDDYPTVAKAVSTNADSSVKYAQAIVESDISNGADGTVVDRLEVGSLDTSGLTSGGAVFLSSTAGGYVTALSSLSGTDYRVQVVGYVGKVDGSTGTIVFGLWDVLPVSIQNQIIVGENDTGYDVTFYGATSGSYMLWDESADTLKLVGATLDMGDNNITNVGDIALDTISSDSGSTITVNLGTDAGDDFIIGSDLFRIGGDNGNIGIGADAGTTASIYMQKPEDQRMLYLNATNATYASEIQRNMSARAANSAYNFLICYSNNGSDTEFNFRGDGEAFADGSFTGSGADYQEYFESTDGSALTVGKVVVLDGGKVRYYNSGTDNADDIIGVVRPKTPNKNSAVRGNAAWNFWTEKYLTDDYGRYVMETYSVYEWTDDDGVYSYPTDQVPNDVTVPNDAETVTTDGNGVTLKRRKLNPNYDPDLAYTPRHDRDEWNLIGLLGQVQIANGETVNSRWVSMGAISGSVNLYYIR